MTPVPFAAAIPAIHRAASRAQGAADQALAERLWDEPTQPASQVVLATLLMLAVTVVALLA